MTRLLNEVPISSTEQTRVKTATVRLAAVRSMPNIIDKLVEGDISHSTFCVVLGVVFVTTDLNLECVRLALEGFEGIFFGEDRSQRTRMNRTLSP